MSPQNALVKSTPNQLSDIAQKITIAYSSAIEHAYKSVEQLVVVGQELLKAEIVAKKSRLPLQDFYEQLPFSQAMVSKYKSIASNAAIANKKNQKSLPTSIATTYELSKIEAETLSDLIKSEVVTQSTTRTEAKQLSVNSAKNIKQSNRGRKQSTQIQVEFAAIRVPTDISDDDKNLILELLHKLKKINSSIDYKIKSEFATDYKEAMKEFAEHNFEEIVQSYPNEFQIKRNLLENAIHTARTNKGKLPKNYKWKSRLEKELGFVGDGERQEAELYKIGRKHKIVCKYLSLEDLYPEASVWVHIMNYCDGNGSALGKLRKLAQLDLSKSRTKDATMRKMKSDAKRLANQYLYQVEAL